MSSPPEGFVRLAAIEEIPLPGVRAFDADGRRIAVYRTAGGVYASDDRCPHRGGPLSEGDLIGTSIVCMWHGWSFDLDSGAADVDPDCLLPRHEVIIHQGGVYVRPSILQVDQPS